MLAVPSSPPAQRLRKRKLPVRRFDGVLRARGIASTVRQKTMYGPEKGDANMRTRVAMVVGFSIAAVAVAVAIAGWWVLSGNINAAYYTQVDNARTEELESRGGVIDPTGGMSLLYRLPAYDEQGNGREVSFGTERQLREGAYLKVEVEPIRGVVGWEEVSFDELPQEAQAHLDGPVRP